MKSKILLPALFLLCSSAHVFSQEKVLDTHIHLYDTNREGSYDFLGTSAKNDPIRFPHLADVFLDSASPSGVEQAYVVEASLRREDNFWLSRITDTSECLPGFSANLDPRASTYRSDLDSLVQNPKFRGIRPRGWGFNLGDVSLQKQFVELARRNLVLELWGNSSDIASIAGMYPNMNIIVNHFAGGNANGGGVAPGDYSDRLAILAAEPNVFIKISMLYALSGQNPAPTEMSYYKALIDKAVNAFGPERVMYGSNWSLSGIRGPYHGMMDLLREYCDQRDGLSREQLFYDNAMKAYGLLSHEVEHSGTGNGLFVSYWNGKAGGRGWFTDSISGTIVPCIDSYWKDISPVPGANKDYWNARFTGELEASFTGSHKLYLTINDMVRLWIDGQLVIDAWSGSETNLCHTAIVDLEAGEKVKIQLDFANFTGDGFSRLEWESQELPREVIPQSQFYNDVDTTSHVSIKREMASSGKVRIYPNPVGDQLCVSWSEPARCEVYSLSGQLMDDFRVSGNLVRRDSSQWPEGIYILHLHNNSNSFFEKIIVNKG